MSSETDDLWNEAMALLLRWQAAPKDARVRDEIVRFCEQGEAHQAAWDNAKRLYRLTGAAMGAPEREKKREKKRKMTRRGVITGLGAIIVGGTALKGPDLLRRWQADMVSDVGVIAQRLLPDGSKLTLGPDSAVKIAFTPASRAITLLDGMAMVDVADDPEHRPFEAHTGELTASSEGGSSFEVRRNSGSSLVGVGSGNVRVENKGKSDDGVLTPGDWLATSPGDLDPRTGHREASQMAAWRDRRVIADEQRIDAVIAEIARWQHARVVIVNPGLASSRVSGLYDLRDPVAALEAVVRPYGGHVRQVTPWLTLVSSV